MDARVPAEDPLIFLIAGEASGDQLGGRLMAALKAESGSRLRFAGIGGEHMAREGLRSLFPMTDLSLMGLVEVLLHIPRILRRLRETTAAIREARPAVVVSIDSPDFSFRVARRLRGSGIPVVHYVAPTVWAWRPGRARRIARILSRLLAVLPFEPPYFTVHGLRCDFVGHPVIEYRRPGDRGAFRARHGIASAATVLCAMPGSRHSDLLRLLPVFRETVALLAQRLPELRVVMPAVGHLIAQLRAETTGWKVPVTLVAETDEKWDAYAASDFALVKSGTGVLETTVAGLPTVVAYRVNPLSAWLTRRLLRTPFVTLPNILLGRALNPELLQERCRPEPLAAALLPLLENESARREQHMGAVEVARLLGAGDEAPSRRAARAVLDEVRQQAGPGFTGNGGGT